MKKLIIRIIVVALAVATLSCLASCSQWDTPYETHGKEGYNVSVKFDVGDGIFANIEDVVIVDLYKMEQFSMNPDGNYEIPLIAPDDSARGDKAFVASRTGYFLAGWYSERALRFNDQGEMLDDFGNVTSDPKKQGYIYSGKWDFDTSTLEIDPSQDYTADNTALTLYAAWVPYYKFETYVAGESTPYSEKSSLSINVPGWDNGKMKMNGFPERQGYTFDGAYLDEECTVPLTEAMHGEFDPLTATSLTPTIKIYTKWREGTWFRIENLDQFSANISSTACYELLCDLDYTGKTWPGAFSTRGGFSGTIIGNGHTIIGVTVNMADTGADRGGIFLTIGSTAKICDLTFENITYNIKAGARKPASFGTLASTVSEGAEITNVTVSGALNIYSTAEGMNLNTSIGLVTSMGNHPGIESDIACNIILEDGSTVSASDIDGVLEENGTINVDSLKEYLSNS